MYPSLPLCLSGVCNNSADVRLITAGWIVRFFISLLQLKTNRSSYMRAIWFYSVSYCFYLPCTRGSVLGSLTGPRVISPIYTCKNVLTIPHRLARKIKRGKEKSQNSTTMPERICNNALNLGHKPKSIAAGKPLPLISEPPVSPMLITLPLTRLLCFW